FGVWRCVHTREGRVGPACGGDRPDVPSCERSGVDAVLPEEVVQGELVVLLAFLKALEHEQDRHAELPTGETLVPVGGDTHRPGRDLASARPLHALRVADASASGAYRA